MESECSTKWGLPAELPDDPMATFETFVSGTTLDRGAQGPGASCMPTVWRRRTAADGGVPVGGPAYEFRQQVGRGGFGEVWEAVQLSLNRTVAVKQMRRDAEGDGDDADLRALFRYEAFTMAALEHPNIVPVYDYGVDEEGRPMLSMKLVRGENWSQVIRREFEAMAPADFLAKHLPILADVAQAVAFAHDAGIVHRDLKPAQVMLGAYGEVLLTDWGLAVGIGGGGGDRGANVGGNTPAPSLSDASAPAGTPSFMAPEQTLSHAEHIGPWTDIYLLGGILYLLLCGAAPHSGGSSKEVYERAANGDVPDIFTRAPGRPIPADLAAIAMAALRPEPADRIASAKDFLAALRESMSGTARRRESLEISSSVAAAMRAGELDYSALTALANQIEQARVLWADNEEAARCREELLSEQVRIALREGDLLLAGTTIDRLASTASRAAFAAELAAAKRARTKRERERRLLRIATAGLLATVLGGGAWFVARLGRARERAEEARSRAEDLLGFMIGDLRKRLEPVGRIDVLDAVAAKASDYLDSLPEEDRGSKAGLQRAEIQMQLGALRHEQGKLDEALSLLAKEATEIGSLPASLRKQKEWTAADARMSARLGNTLFQAGKLAEAIEAFKKAEAGFATLLDDEPGSAAWASAMADALRGLGEATAMSGNWPAAEATFERGLARLPLAPGPGLPRAELERQRAELLNRLGIAQQQANSPRADATHRESVAILDSLAAEFPDDAAIRNLRLSYAVSYATYLNSIKRSEEAVQRLDAAAAIARKLSESDPANLEWKSDFAYTLTHLGNALISTGDQRRAVDTLGEAMRLHRHLTAANPANMEWWRDLGQACNSMGRAKRDLGRPGEALDSYLEGARAMADCLRLQPGGFNHRIILDDCAHFAMSAAEQVAGAGDPITASGAFFAVREWAALEPKVEPPTHGQWVALGNAFSDRARAIVDAPHSDLSELEAMLPGFAETLRAVGGEGSGSEVWNASALLLLEARLHDLRGELDTAESCYVECEAALAAMQDFNDFGRQRRFRLIAASLRQRGFIALRRGDADRAAAMAEAALLVLDDCDRLDVDPALRADASANRALTLVLRGLAYDRKGVQARALADWNEALRRSAALSEPGRAPALIPLAAAFHLLGLTPEADAVMETLGRAGTDSPELALAFESPES